MATEQDKELEAIGAIMKALSELDAPQQKSALEYVMGRLGVKVSRTDSGEQFAPPKDDVARDGQVPKVRDREMVDIRTLKDEKKPKSAIQMAVLVAYYLARIVPADQRVDVIGTAEIDKYFDQAKYPLPKNSGVLLGDAKRAGYLESAERGKYKLNPVGYNLAAHNMGSGNGGVSRASTSGKKKKGGKKN